MDKHKIDKLYEQKFAKFEVPTNSNSWNEFELLLNKKKRKRFFWIFSYTLAFLSLSWGTYINWPSENIIPKIVLNSSPNNQKSNDILTSKTSNPSQSPINATEKQTSQTTTRFFYNQVKPVRNISNLPEIMIVPTAKNKSNEEELKTTNIVKTKSLMDTMNETNKSILAKATPDSSIIVKPKPHLKQSPWSINIILAYGFIPNINCYANDSTNHTIHRDYVSLRNSNEVIKGSVSLNFGLQYQFNKFISIATGITYKNISQQTAYNFAKTEIPIIDSSTGKNTIIGYNSIPANQASQLILIGVNQYNMLEIPLQMKLNIGLTKTTQIFASGSYGLSYLVGLHGQTLSSTTLSISKLNRTNSPIALNSNHWQYSCGLKQLITVSSYFIAELYCDKYYMRNSLQQNYNFKNLGIKAGINFLL